MSRIIPEIMRQKEISSINMKINEGDYAYVNLRDVLDVSSRVSQVGITLASLEGTEMKVYTTNSQGDNSWTQELDSASVNPFTTAGITRNIYEMSRLGLKIEPLNGGCDVYITFS